MRCYVAQSRLAFIILVVLVNIIVVAIAFEAGRQMKSVKPDESGVYYTQAILAFGHYTSYEEIKGLMEKGCYDAALTVVREMQNLQINLLSDNLKSMNNDPDLLEYINLRNPELLKAIMAGHIPELRAYTTICLGQTGQTTSNP
jgi:hypothetical protein